MKRPAILAAIALLILLGIAWFALHPRSYTTPPLDARDSGPTTRLTSPTPIEKRATPMPLRSATASMDGGPKAGRQAGTAVLKGTWGSGPGQFARRRDPESNPEAPMTLLAGPNGELTIVDQVNRRVQRFKDGKLIGTIPIGGDTVQDVTALEGGKTALLDRLADRNVQVYDKDGKLLNEVPIVGKNVPEGGAVTGLFSDDKGIYVEREHGALVRIADANGNADPDRTEMVGRPSRDGRLLLAASLNGVDRAAGEVMVKAFERATGKPLWEQKVSLGAPILHLLMLDSDRAGQVYVGGATGRESPAPPYQIVDESIGVARLGPGGSPRGEMTLPAFPTADETFRPMSVDDNGNVFLMVTGPDGLQVLRFAFP